MFDAALNHLPLVIAFVAFLIAHMLRLDRHASPALKPRTPSRRRPFGNRMMNGEMVLVDPDGRITRSRRR